ncbi:MAG: aminotransferase class V-fold PLP-dependent enzyme [Clostridiaceae bacterium]
MTTYFDNASTSFPKPPSVTKEICNFINNIGGNPGRGSYDNSMSSARIMYNCRVALSEFFGFNKPENIIFTQNITLSLNILLKGIIKPNFHVITSTMEHNSVLRVLYNLKEKNIIQLDVIEGNKFGFVSVDDVKSKIRDNTKLIVLSHASNVTGCIQPLESIGKLCKDNDIFFIVDSAQSAGSIPVDFSSLNCDALAFTGHKALLGPQGIGGFIINDKMNEHCAPFIEGGTGSSSSSLLQPANMPDKFESGTQNVPGIVGLLEGIKFLNSEGLHTITEKKKELTRVFIEELCNLDKYTLYNTEDINKIVPTISFNHNTIENSELEFILNSSYGITSRSGLHCAPLAHKTIGTYPHGTIRFSFGYFNTIKEVKDVLHILNKL